MEKPTVLARSSVSEVEATRRRAFGLFRHDADLLKEINTPSGEARTLLDLLLETLARSAHQQGCAYAVARLFSDARPPGL